MASLGSFGWGLALGFALVFISVASVVFLQTISGEALKVTAGAARGRGFKGEALTVPLALGSKPGIVLSEFALVSVPDGVSGEIVGEGLERTLVMRSRFAGVYRGIRVRVGILDPLRIMARNETHEVAHVFEFLPTHLLSKTIPLSVSASMLGDYPAGRRGFGQEFYSAEVYSPSSSSRDILWKRLAKLPDGDPMVRVGEANIPETFTLCFVDSVKPVERASPTWMDLASEAVARVGLPVVTLGITFRLVHVVKDVSTVAEARNAEGLANLVMGLWRELGVESAQEGPEDADMLLVSQKGFEVPELFRLVLDKPTVVLSWGGRVGPVGGKMVFFTGNEDVNALVTRVLSR